MNRWYQSAAVILFAATAAVGQETIKTALPRAQSASAQNKDLREIERLEFEWNRINEVSDAEGKERLLAEDSYHVGPSGRTYTKAQDIAAAQMTEERNRASNSTLGFIMTDKHIKLYKDIAVVTATGTSFRTDPDGRKKLGNSFRAVHVWEKRDGRWLLVVDQVTGIGN